VNIDYYAKAKQLDHQFNGTAMDGIGPVQQVLKTFGINGKVRGLGVGTFAECSVDFHELRKFIATVLADKEVTGTNIPVEDVKGRIARSFLSVIGHTIHRGWARLLLGRIPIILNRQRNDAGSRGDNNLGGNLFFNNDSNFDNLHNFTQLNFSQELFN
jgi:hypothetical protein